MFYCNFYFSVFNKLKERNDIIMEFWLIMIGFIVMGGSCSLAGTWWDRKNKKDKKEEKKQ